MTTKEERQNWVNRMWVELSIHNFGLPPDVQYKETSLQEALKLRALKELQVRMNLYVATNEPSHGSIDFPEAKRRIDYNFNSKNTKHNKVNLKALQKNYFIDVRT